LLVFTVAVSLVACSSVPKPAAQSPYFGQAFQSATNVEGRAKVSMVRVDGSSFTLGSDSGSPDSAPAHQATVGSFLISTTEITNKQLFGTKFFDLLDPLPHRTIYQQQQLNKAANIILEARNGYTIDKYKGCKSVQDVYKRFLGYLGNVDFARLRTANFQRDYGRLTSFNLTPEEIEYGEAMKPFYPCQENIDTPALVSWEEAVAFCNYLSKLEGLDEVYSFDSTPISGTWYSAIANVKADFGKNGYRLPTNAEWEFAAKGGRLSKHTKYSGSDNPADVAVFGFWTKNWPDPVMTKKPNELGLYDMSGNVFEWCWDYYEPYTADAVDNPRGPAETPPEPVNLQAAFPEHVLRGGSYISSSSAITNEVRTIPRTFMFPQNEPKVYIRQCGFRVVRTITE
jgi:formylglycine-generating enzyme required for sulfatase activity